MTLAMPNDELNQINQIKALFGTAGVTFARIAAGLLPDLIGRKYQFMALEEYRAISYSSIADSQRIYWREILYRAHWAAATTILRHREWQLACVRLWREPPNYLAFCSALRGLVESAVDAFYSLKLVPLTLAELHVVVEEALSDRSNTVTTSSEVEDGLIHFLYGRRMLKGEVAPKSHVAETIDTYIKGTDPEERFGLKALYAVLCQVTHPAAHSLAWMVDQDNDTVVLTGGDDRTMILSLCGDYTAALDHMHMSCMNSALLTLKVLNHFGLRETYSPFADKLKFGNIPAWGLIEQAFQHKAALMNQRVQ